MFKFNKHLRSGTRTSTQNDSDNERGNSWSPKLSSKPFGHVKRSASDGEDIGRISDTELSFAENLFPVKTSPASIPVRKLQRSKQLQRSKHSIDTSLLSGIVDKYDSSSPRSPLALAGGKSVDVIKEYPHTISRKTWTSEIQTGGFLSSGSSRRKSCEPVLCGRSSRSGHCESNRTVATDHTCSKRDNSGRSWIDDSTDDDEKFLDWSLSSVSYDSQREDSVDQDEAIEYADAEERFLQANKSFSDTSMIEDVRQDQYPKLSLHRHVYMDYASLALSSRFQMEEHMKIVMAEGQMLGTISSSFAEYAACAQGRLLQMLNTSRSEYSVVFTTGLKASYRLVANAYPFQKGSPVLLCQDNHEYVSQLITAAVKAGGKPVLAPLEETDLSMTKASIRPLMKRHIFQPSGSLFVYPAQSSVTGIRHSMHWINKAHKSGWHVLLDASTLLPTGTLDLQKNQPDFVLGSFQNIVGYPSGMGFLLVRRTSFLVNHAPNSNSITLTPRMSPTQGKDCHIVAEDESLSKLSFAGLDLGLQHLQSIGLNVINRRVMALATWMVHKLKGLRHIDPDDWSLVNVYSPYMAENRGNIISFNILDSTGEVIKPTLVQVLAAKNQITLAVGSFCNPGVANLLGPAKDRVKNISVFERAQDFQCVQVSLGAMSNFEDAYRVLQFVSRFRDQDYALRQKLESHQPTPNFRDANWYSS